MYGSVLIILTLVSLTQVQTSLLGWVVTKEVGAKWALAHLHHCRKKLKNEEKIADLVVGFGGIFRNKRLGRVRALVDRLFLINTTIVRRKTS